MRPVRLHLGVVTNSEKNESLSSATAYFFFRLLCNFLLKFSINFFLFNAHSCYPTCKNPHGVPMVTSSDTSPNNNLQPQHKLVQLSKRKKFDINSKFYAGGFVGGLVALGENERQSRENQLSFFRKDNHGVKLQSDFRKSQRQLVHSGGGGGGESRGWVDSVAC